jgi:hypothetical protein
VEMITQARLDLRKVDNGGMFDLPILVVCEAGAGTVLAEDTARQFAARVGSRLTFDARDKTIQATVSTIRKLTPAERVWSNVRLDCSSLDRRILFHQAVVRVAPERISAVRRAVGAEYPTYAVITPDDVAETVKAVSEDAMVLARLVAWFAIGAGVSLLVAIVAASRTARTREFGILTALGARPGTEPLSFDHLRERNVLFFSVLNVDAYASSERLQERWIAMLDFLPFSEGVNGVIAGCEELNREPLVLLREELCCSRMHLRSNIRWLGTIAWHR